MDHPFRSAAFGGFNRQDVLTYLENMAKEAAQQQQALQQQLDEAREALNRQSGDLTGQQSQLEQLRQENGELRTSLEQTRVELSASRIECGQAASALETARREAEEWKARTAALEPDATAYAAIKERAAGVELDAHHRAQLVQDEARRQAAELHRQTEEWMRQVEQEYDALKSEVESTVSHAADQLDRAGRCLDQVNGLLEERGTALETLFRRYTDGASSAE